MSLRIYLEQDYPKHFKISLPLSSPLRTETTHDASFEIKDKKPTIIQPAGKGVSSFSNPRQKEVEIFDFEQYFNNFKHKAKEGGKCDFIIVPAIGYDYLILNELTETKIDYILPFVQPKTGESRKGKLQKAREQLLETINKLNHIPGFLNKFQKKTALFSYRLPENTNTANIATQSMGVFLNPTKIASSITMSQPMPQGFVFEQRVYPKDFIIE